MEHGGQPDLRAEMFGIGSNRVERLGGGLEQEIVNHVLVVKGDVGDGGRHGEHDVVILDRQEIGLSCLQPTPGGAALTLRAVAVATRVVGVLGGGAVFTAQHVTAEGDAATLFDGGHHLQLRQAEMSGARVPPRCGVGTEEIGDLQRRSRHDCRALRSVRLSSDTPVVL